MSKKNKMGRFLLFLVLTIMTLPHSTAHADTVNAGNNAYYKEVSEMASALTANFKDEKERECCYNVMMAGVFGKHYYNDWNYSWAEKDLICVIDTDETNLLLSEFAVMYGMVIYYDLGNGKHYYCSKDIIPLNSNGIKEQNYTGLKSIYQAAETLRAQTAGMDVTGKARTVHDYMVARYTPGPEKDRNEHGAIWMEATGTGVCSAYMTMFLILGRYVGLDVGSLEYWSNYGTMHTINTVTMENGEVRYVDVMWDDIENGHAYFLETEAENRISHQRIEGKAPGRFDIK